MTPMERVAAYIQAWNDHDADAVLATLGPSGTYEDPTTGGPVNGEAFRAGGLDARLMRRLADQRRLEADDVARLGDDAAELLKQWLEAGWLHGR